MPNNSNVGSMIDTLRGMSGSNQNNESENEKVFIGYVVGSDGNTVSVLLPTSSFAKPIIKLSVKGKSYGCYDKYELFAFKFTMDRVGNILSWRMVDCRGYVETKKFVALFADGRVLTNDGKTYKVYDNPKLNDKDGTNHIDWIISRHVSEGCKDIDLYIYNGVIYGSNSNGAGVTPDSWFVEDALAVYLDSHNRYKVDNIGKRVAMERDSLYSEYGVQ